MYEHFEGRFVSLAYSLEAATKMKKSGRKVFLVILANVYRVPTELAWEGEWVIFQPGDWRTSPAEIARFADVMGIELTERQARTGLDELENYNAEIRTKKGKMGTWVTLLNHKRIFGVEFYCAEIERLKFENARLRSEISRDLRDLTNPINLKSSSSSEKTKNEVFEKLAGKNPDVDAELWAHSPDQQKLFWECGGETLGVEWLVGKIKEWIDKVILDPGLPKKFPSRAKALHGYLKDQADKAIEAKKSEEKAAALFPLVPGLKTANYEPTNAELDAMRCTSDIMLTLSNGAELLTGPAGQVWARKKFVFDGVEYVGLTELPPPLLPPTDLETIRQFVDPLLEASARRLERAARPRVEPPKKVFTAEKIASAERALFSGGTAQ